MLDALKTKGIAIRVASPKLVMEEAPESYKVSRFMHCFVAELGVYVAQSILLTGAF